MPLVFADEMRVSCLPVSDERRTNSESDELRSAARTLRPTRPSLTATCLTLVCFLRDVISRCSALMLT